MFSTRKLNFSYGASSNLYNLLTKLFRDYSIPEIYSRPDCYWRSDPYYFRRLPALSLSLQNCPWLIE